MATKTCYYEVLNVERSSTKQQIDRAYRKLAIKYHPDTNKGDDAVARFKEATEAYEVLSDQAKRARYDQYGHAGVEGATHQYNDVRSIVAGGSKHIVSGQHINMPEGTPLANLWLTQARMLGSDMPRFADSTGEIAALKVG